MILTPARWIVRQRQRETATLRQALADLATRWENTDLSASEGMFGAIAGEATLKECAAELRTVLQETR